MDAIRKIVHLDSMNIYIPELEKWQNKDVEIIILPAEEKAEEKSEKKNIQGFGLFKNEIQISDDFDEPLNDIKEYMP